jgi:hypothetical protein
MKLHPDFKILSASNSDCHRGGSNHSLIQTLDDCGFFNGYRCVNCDKTVVKKTRHRVAKGITIKL